MTNIVFNFCNGIFLAHVIARRAEGKHNIGLKSVLEMES